MAYLNNCIPINNIYKIKLLAKTMFETTISNPNRLESCGFGQLRGKILYEIAFSLNMKNNVSNNSLLLIIRILPT